MILRDLIDALERCDPATLVPIGFGHPHSYRGYYDELAFEAVDDTTVGAMLEAAREALGTTYHGWKGGDYTMNAYTPCWLVRSQGMSDGDGIGPVLLAYMTGQAGKGPVRW